MTDKDVEVLLKDQCKNDPDFKEIMERYRDIPKSNWFIQAYENRSVDIIHIEGDEDF
jgi:hypothetical protein